MFHRQKKMYGSPAKLTAEKKDPGETAGSSISPPAKLQIIQVRFIRCLCYNRQHLNSSKLKP